MLQHAPKHIIVHTHRDVRVVQALALVLALEGLGALVATLASPSMERRAVLLGLSAPRLVLQAALVAIVLALLLAAIKAIVHPSWLDRAFLAIDTHVANHHERLAILLASLLAASALASYILALVASSQVTVGLARIFLSHYLPIIVWLFLIPLELLLAIGLLYPAEVRSEVQRASADPRPLLPVVVLFAGGLQCLTLLLGAGWLHQIPGWFWEATPKGIQLSHLLFFPFITVGLLIVRRLVSPSSKPVANLALSVALLFSLQVAFGAAAGGGFESLRMKYVDRGQKHEVREVCEYHGGVTLAIESYELHFAKDIWLGTKPPGLVATFIVIRETHSADLTRESHGIRPVFQRCHKTHGVSLPIACLPRTDSPVLLGAADWPPRLLPRCIGPLRFGPSSIASALGPRSGDLSFACRIYAPGRDQGHAFQICPLGTSRRPALVLLGVHELQPPPAHCHRA